MQKQMERIDAEIERVKVALERTKSDKLRRDYRKHLRQLEELKREIEIPACVFTALCVLLAFACAWFGSSEMLIDTGRMRYECLIGDDVSLSELLDEYDIVGKRGKIYIFETKEGFEYGQRNCYRSG